MVLHIASRTLRPFWLPRQLRQRRLGWSMLLEAWRSGHLGGAAVLRNQPLVEVRDQSIGLLQCNLLALGRGLQLAVAVDHFAVLDADLIDTPVHPGERLDVANDLGVLDLDGASLLRLLGGNACAEKPDLLGLCHQQRGHLAFYGPVHAVTEDEARRRRCRPREYGDRAKKQL